MMGGFVLVRRAARGVVAVAVFLFLAAGADAPPPAADQAFLADLVDIPLAEGLKEVEAERLVFDKPDGRIVHAAAAGKGMSVLEVEEFYRETLPQLGWSEKVIPEKEAAGRLLFVRDEEQLEIALETAYETLVVRFFLEPVP